ncbi:mitochondrial inner membrane protease subunit 2-like isoform X1 [Dinothrombium tinctorium]|uniref:Mitochondrial inner membrane protease subunit 2-like isoform X1 n=1 Tax=Dinothrombium tinctorium TaxID=1965070 RepID=A0A3S3SML7_9ACAR|nr:mitochondrial inner membrane protease subunit 2-like isoform X1 [Dinothrombium tinctorium]
MWKGPLKRLLNIRLLDIPIIVYIFNNVGSVAKVEGESMQPTLNPDGKRGNSDYVFLNKWSVREFNVSRGQVVALT